MKTYSAEDVRLISEWVEKYFEVSALINNVFGTSINESFPRMPSIENEIEYQHLRLWFFKNHDNFIAIWADFCQSKGISTNFNGSIDDMQYMENPFFYYYPDNLLDIAYVMGVRSSDDIGYLDEQDRAIVVCMNKMFSNTVVRLANWVGEFAETSN
jgi:hypothetical protein